LSASLATGFKGLNHYMFVDRDHWYGAPLRNDGTVSPGYDVLRNFNNAVTTVGVEEMDQATDVCVVGNRTYQWLRDVSRGSSFEYVRHLIDESTVGFVRDLMRLKLNWGVRENRDWESLSGYKVLFIPTTEIMSEKDQEAIVELVKNGVTVILSGLMPKYDENLKECKILSNSFRIKTTNEYSIASVNYKTTELPTHAYGHIRSTDDAKTRKLVTIGAKAVGAVSSRYKGRLYMFTFDLASGGDHHKLMFIESILEQEGVTTSLYCSDPTVDVSFQTSDKKGLLFVVAPPPGELSGGFEAGHKNIIIQADLKKLGFKGTNIKLTSLFEDEEAKPIKTTIKDLKQGLSLDIKFPDGMAYLVEKR
jgi:hypothetical protein